MSEAADDAHLRPVGARDIPGVLLWPRRVFARLEDVKSWGWPLVILLLVVTLVGLGIVETGLIDRSVDQVVAQRIAKIDQQQRDIVERSQLREEYEKQIKLGEFERFITRIRVVAAEPARVLTHVLVIAAVLYGAVALSGRKPEWNTLLTICVLATYTEVLRLLVQLGLMLQTASLNADTSLAPVVRLWFEGQTPEPTLVAVWMGLLSGLDPFRLWFWVLIGTGLVTTAQLKSWRAWTVCVLGWLTGIGIRCGLLLATVASTPAK